jgi:hypothetical protein
MLERLDDVRDRLLAELDAIDARREIELEENLRQSLFVATVSCRELGNQGA